MYFTYIKLLSKDIQQNSMTVWEFTRDLTHWGRVTHIGVGKLSLVQIMACHLDGAKPLSEPMLEYC